LSWDAFTHYVAGNKVLYQGISYIALGNSTGIAPPTNDVLWAVLQVGTVSLFTLNSLLLDSAIAGVLIFNGTLWDEPGQEKKLRRIQVYYENYGIFTLTATVSVWRPSISADFFDQKIVTVSAGSALADLSERTMFFDIQIAGEIILLQLSRAASSGPVSITGALPEFEEGGGEKVAGR
jgi:hypothetical protein